MAAKDGRVQPLSTRAFGPRLRRLTALTALATRPLLATKRSTVRCGQSVCKCHAEKFRSANFARILTAVHTSVVSRSIRPSLDPKYVFKGKQRRSPSRCRLDQTTCSFKDRWSPRMAGPLACRELDDTLGLTATAGEMLASRQQ